MTTAVRIREIDVEVAYLWLECGIAWFIDVREEHERSRGAIPHALFHPFSTFDPSFLPYVDPVLGLPRRLVFYCQQTEPASKAAHCWADEIGAAVAFVLQGGVEEWSKAGLPINM